MVSLTEVTIDGVNCGKPGSQLQRYLGGDAPETAGEKVCEKAWGCAPSVPGRQNICHSRGNGPGQVHLTSSGQ